MEPFLAGAEYVPNQFVGRKKDVDTLIANLKTGGARVYLAEARRMGKTWFIKKVLDEARNMEIPSVYLDLAGMQTTRDLCEKWVRGVIGALGIWKKETKPKENVQRYFKAMAPLISNEGEVRFDWRPTAKMALDALEEAMDATEELCLETPKKKMVMALDEFQEIGFVIGGRSRLKRAGAEQILRSHIQQQRRTNYIFSGSRMHLLERMFVDKARPFYKSATPATLSPITPDEWEIFIEETFRGGGITVSPETCSEIMGKTQGHPYYTQSLCRRLWIDAVVKKGERIGRVDVEAGMKQILTDEHNYFYRDWTDLTNLQRVFLKNVAEWGGKELYTMDFIHGSGLTAGQIQATREALIEDGILEEKEAEAVVSDPFFRQWILHYHRSGGVESYPV